MPTLCDPIDGSPPGSSVPGILQARILEWVAISFSIWTLSLYYYIKHKITVSVLIQYKIWSIHPVFLIKISLRIFTCSRSIPRTTNMFIFLGTQFSLFNTVTVQNVSILLSPSPRYIQDFSLSWILIHIQLILLCVCVSHSVVSDSANPWSVARQAPLSMGLSRQEYWSELPCPPPGDLPNLGTEPGSPAL